MPEIQTGSDWTIIRIYTDVVNDELRLFGHVISADDYTFSIALNVSYYDEALANFGKLLPAIARYDAWQAELYDGNLEIKQPGEAIEIIATLKAWLKSRDLKQHGDLFPELE